MNGLMDDPCCCVSQRAGRTEASRVIARCPVIIHDDEDVDESVTRVTRGTAVVWGLLLMLSDCGAMGPACGVQGSGAI